MACDKFTTDLKTLLDVTSFDEFCEVPPSEDKIVFSTQPGGAVHGEALRRQPVVRITDDQDQLAYASTSTVTLSVASGGATVGPASNTSVATIGGVVTYTGLTLSGTTPTGRRVASDLLFFFVFFRLFVHQNRRIDLRRAHSARLGGGSETAYGASSSSFTKRNRQFTATNDLITTQKECEKALGSVANHTTYGGNMPYNSVPKGCFKTPVVSI